MNIKSNLIYLLIVVAILSGCRDDDLFIEGTAGNPDAITFSTAVVRGFRSPSTRSGEDEYLDPLMLSDGVEENQLYLHSYVTSKIGYRPGKDVTVDPTRAVQISSVTDLAQFHENFKVLAVKSEDEGNYFGWKDAKVMEQTENKVWLTERTEYWPSDEPLTFYAVSPKTAYTTLTGLHSSDRKISFSYVSPKGTSDDDAESQSDLLLSVTECRKSESISGRAPVSFHHALSAIKFGVRDVVGGEVVNIKISGVASEGECLFDPSVEDGNPIIWSDVKGTETYSQDFNYAVSDRMVDAEDVSKDEILNGSMPTKTFMMIPQEIPEEAEIIVTYRRQIATPQEITVRGKIRDNLVTEWLPGHEYVYIISTSKDNWIYEFNVLGNEEEGYDNIYIYSPNDDRFADAENRGYYSVESYRWRANHPSDIEPLPWEATFDGSEGYLVGGSSETVYPDKAISAEKWLTDLGSSKFKGDGGNFEDFHWVDFYPHYLVTDWPGDEILQGNRPYRPSMMNRATPYDLSTFGGTESRSTANCYVVDRGGWYMIPLVYGNAMVRGGSNESSYRCNGTHDRILPVLTDYLGNPVAGPEISGGSSADLVWQDAYNMVSEVSLEQINGEKMIRFYVDADNLQQGNAIIALKDSRGEVMWSWHIWATEHWLDPDGKPHALSDNAAYFSAALNTSTQIRERGDATVTFQQPYGSCHMASYTLGWCDPKNVIYLKRKGRMDFRQYLSETGEETATASLDLIQQGETVNYKVGNNLYYQFGRKDPQVGFADRKKNYKANFGPVKFKPEDSSTQFIRIRDGIRHPEYMYVNLTSINIPETQDWTRERYLNLWNNSSDVSRGCDYGPDLWSQVKTIYDPSPVGYVVPNAGVWRVLGECDYNDRGEPTWQGVNCPDDPTFNGKFNGERDRLVASDDIENLYVYKVYGTGRADDPEGAIYLVPTGNRWYSNGHTFKQEDKEGQEETIEAGKNFNLRIFYAWSSRWNNEEYAAYSAAIGIDALTTTNYFLGAHFHARRAMGRPVRPIRDLHF